MSRQITGAVIEELNAPFKLETLEVDDQPKAHEVLVHIVASGICHSDEAVRNGSAGEYPYPGVVGHEGAGIVEKIGSSVTTVKQGDTLSCHMITMGLVATAWRGIHLLVLIGRN